MSDADKNEPKSEAEAASKPAAMTDPARELVELCEALFDYNERHVLGEDYLASRFDVPVWSRQFYQIIFTVSERVDLLVKIIGTLDLDEDFRSDIQDHVKAILLAFTGPALRDHWESNGQKRVSPTNVQPLKGVSGLVRAKIGYKKLSEEEIADTLNQVAQLIDRLDGLQISEQDFIRQALIEGLYQFKFRLEKVRWLGWGYALDSLREVVAAYVMLERTGVSPENNPDAAAVLKLVGDLLKSVHKRVQTAKGVVESGDFLLKMYGAGALWYQGKPFVAGLLGSG